MLAHYSGFISIKVQLCNWSWVGRGSSPQGICMSDILSEPSSSLQLRRCAYRLPRKKARQAGLVHQSISGHVRDSRLQDHSQDRPWEKVAAIRRIAQELILSIFAEERTGYARGSCNGFKILLCRWGCNRQTLLHTEFLAVKFLWCFIGRNNW